MIWAAAVVVALGLVFYFVFARKPRAPTGARPPDGESNPRPQVPHQFWGQQLIVPDPAHACRRARALNGNYFDNGRVPHLPLPECDSPRCTCWFKVAGDNRSNEERRLDMERRERPRINVRVDRRTGRDRRADSNDTEGMT